MNCGVCFSLPAKNVLWSVAHEMGHWHYLRQGCAGGWYAFSQDPVGLAYGGHPALAAAVLAAAFLAAAAADPVYDAVAAFAVAAPAAAAAAAAFGEGLGVGGVGSALVLAGVQSADFVLASESVAGGGEGGAADERGAEERGKAGLLLRHAVANAAW